MAIVRVKSNSIKVQLGDMVLYCGSMEEVRNLKLEASKVGITAKVKRQGSKVSSWRKQMMQPSY